MLCMYCDARRQGLLTQKIMAGKIYSFNGHGFSNLGGKRTERTQHVMTKIMHEVC